MNKDMFKGFLLGVATVIVGIFLVGALTYFLSNAWFYYDVEPIPAPDLPVEYYDGVRFARM